MEKVVVDDATLAYEVSGTGEPGILIPGALIAEAFRPLLAEPNLVGGYQLIIYHRHEYWAVPVPPVPSIWRSKSLIAGDWRVTSAYNARILSGIR